MPRVTLPNLLTTPRKSHRLTEPLTLKELAVLFRCHRNQVRRLVLENYPYIQDGKKFRLPVDVMPPAYVPKTKASPIPKIKKQEMP